MNKGVCTGENKYAESRVYVACLTCYNEGRLTGRTMTSNELSDWLSTHDDGRDDTIPHLSDCLDPTHQHLGEWAIHDYDGDISKVNMGEHPDLEDLIWHMDFIDTQTNAVPAVQLAWMIHSTPDIADIEHVYENMEVIERVRDWAYDTCKDCGYIQDTHGWHPQDYIDWQQVGEDMLHDYYYVEYGNSIYAIHTMA